jgi:hypothetical protein
LDQVRETIQRKHYSRRTEESYEQKNQLGRLIVLPDNKAYNPAI